MVAAIRMAILSLAALAGLLLGPQRVQAAVALPAYVVDSTHVSVSGLSSGGFMASQLHVAYSATFRRGAGVVAGGPFYCAEGLLTNATGRCMDATATNKPPTSRLIGITNDWAAAGYIDPPSNLSGAKVYLYSSPADTTVKKLVMDEAYNYYANYMASGSIVYKNNISSEHAMVTDYHGNACSYKGTPYINNCGFDLAGAMLDWIHGPLNAKNTGALAGSLIEFDQSEFLANPTTHGMAATGWLYVPVNCANQGTCKLHVALHGCQQDPTKIGDQFYSKTGYNKWADSNDIIVLYPQTAPSSSGNPNGCWDWWAYDDANYAKKSGRQMAAIKAMVDRVMSGKPRSTKVGAPTNLAVGTVGNQSVTLSWTASSGTALAGYNVYRALPGGSFAKDNTSLVTTTSYLDDGLQTGTTYRWIVRAQDTDGLESADSNEVTAKTTGPSTVAFESIVAEDGYVKAYADGSSAAIGTYATPAIGRGSDDKFNRTILSFDTSAIPDDAAILEAFVVVTHSSSSGDPWASPAGNTLVVDVKSGTFGAAATETSDWAATATAPAVATIDKFTSGSQFSTDFSAAGLAAIDKTGRTQLRLLFSGNQSSTSYVFIKEGMDAKLYVTYDTGGSSAPDAPTNLAAGTVTSSSVALSWTASVGAVAGYNVYRSATAGGPYSRDNASLVTGTAYTDDGLSACATYFWIARAVDGAGVESANSNETSAKTSGCTTTTTINVASVASEDGYVKAYADGTSAEVGIYSTPYVGRGTDSKLNRAVLSFDTSAIPDGAAIKRAYLTLTYYTLYGDPWANPVGNTLVIDVKSGTFGAAGTETGDWGAAATAAAVASVAKFTSGTKASGDFSSAGLAAINKAGKTQVRLRFSSNQSSTNYLGIYDGSSAVLTVVYE